MSRMRTMLKGRKLLLLAGTAIVALAILVLSVPTAEAVAGPGVCIYYKDATFRKVVGTRGTGCCGEPISSGTTSKYVRCETLLCTDVVCPF